MTLMFRQFALAVTIAAGALSAQAAPVTITFNEIGAPVGALDGTTFYQTYGIAGFANAVRFGADPRLPDDGFGITNSPGASGTVIFGEDMSAVSLTWAVAGGGVTFNADLFDASNVLVGSFSSGGVGLSGVASFAATNVRSIVFRDSGSQVAIDTLNFTRGAVPEPVTLSLVGMGLLAAGIASRRRAA